MPVQNRGRHSELLGQVLQLTSVITAVARAMGLRQLQRSTVARTAAQSMRNRPVDMNLMSNPVADHIGAVSLEDSNRENGMDAN